MNYMKLKHATFILLQAEYLFKENPQGRMFHPEYTREVNELFKSLNRYGKLLHIDSKIHLA